VIRAEQNGQNSFRADVFQGTSTLVSHCEYLGSVDVMGLPSSDKGGILAEVQFRMSEDGTLALAMQDRTKSGFRRLGLRYQAAKARSRKADPRADPRGLAYLRKLLGGR
jgi:molecular chaperone DnaK (HSP70)